MKPVFVLLTAVMVLATALTTSLAWAGESSSPRLKYKGKGPVCMCSEGLSEEDLRKAWEARFTQTGSPPEQRTTDEKAQERSRADEAKH